MDVVFSQSWLRIGLNNRDLGFRRVNSNKLKRRKAAAWLILWRDLGFACEGTIGLRPFIDVSLHVEKCRIALENAVEFHRSSSAAPEDRGGVLLWNGNGVDYFFSFSFSPSFSSS